MDDFTLSVIVGLAGSAAFSLVLVLLWRASRRSAAARAALAERRGMLFEDIAPGGGRSGRHVYTDTARGMVLEITRPRQGDGGSQNGQCSLRLMAPRLQDGLALWMRGVPAGIGGQRAVFGGLTETRLVQMLLRKVLGEEIAPHLPHLREVPQSGAGMTLLTNADPATLPPALPIAAALGALPARRGDQALAILSTSGLTLRLSAAVTDPKGIEAILDAGLALREALR